MNKTVTRHECDRVNGYVAQTVEILNAILYKNFQKMKNAYIEEGNISPPKAVLPRLISGGDVLTLTLKILI